jgi:hypothetical protein
MARVFLWVMLAITAVLFFAAFSLVVGAFNAASAWHVSSLPLILGAIKNVFSYFLYFGLAIASSYIYLLGPPSVYQNLMQNTAQPLIFQFLDITFHMTSVTGNVVSYSSLNDMLSGPQPIFSLLAGQGLEILKEGYFLVLLLCLFLAVVYFLIFLGKGDIKYSVYSVVSMISPIIIVYIPGMIVQILQILAIPDRMGAVKWASFLVIFHQYLPAVTFTNDSTTANHVPVNLTFFLQDVFWYALLVYLYLEASFQAAYVARVTQPSIERTRRLQGQIAILEASTSTSEAEREQALVPGEAAPDASGAEKRRLNLKNFFTGGGIDMIRQLLERREREREQERLQEVSSDTQRLNSYISRLFEVDTTARQTLTATGSAPSSKNMVSSTLLNVALRIVFISLLVYLIANPPLLAAVFNFGPAITQSVAFEQPEAIITMLIPIALLFPVIAFAIRTYKRYRLTILKNKREADSEMLRRISELRAIEEAETVATEAEKPVSAQKPST